MKDDGGAAFANWSLQGDCQPGMSLRDYFAGQATQEDIDDYLPHTMGELGEWCKKHNKDATQVRAWARYRFAAAMLAERLIEAGFGNVELLREHLWNQHGQYCDHSEDCRICIDAGMKNHD